MPQIKFQKKYCLPWPTNFVDGNIVFWPFGTHAHSLSFDVDCKHLWHLFRIAGIAPSSAKARSARRSTWRQALRAPALACENRMCFSCRMQNCNPEAAHMRQDKATAHLDSHVPTNGGVEGVAIDRIKRKSARRDTCGQDHESSTMSHVRIWSSCVSPTRVIRATICAHSARPAQAIRRFSAQVMRA